MYQPLMVDARSLVNLVSGNSIGDEEEYFSFIDEYLQAPFDDLVKFLSLYMGDSIEAYAGNEYGSVQLDVKGKGVNKLFRNLVLLKKV